jgi:hypothetical protein
MSTANYVNDANALPSSNSGNGRDSNQRADLVPSSLKEKILKILTKTTAAPLQLSTVTVTSTATNEAGVLLEQLQARLAQQQSKAAALATELLAFEKKNRTNPENSDMIINTVTMGGLADTATNLPLRFKTLFPIYEQHPTDGGFYPIMTQDLNRFTDLSDDSNFETEEVTTETSSNTQQQTAVAVVDAQQHGITTASATERARQAFQNYGAGVVTSPAQPANAYSSFTPTQVSPSVEQVIMEQQQLQARKPIQLSPDFFNEMKPAPEAEFSSNVKTLIRLVNELPEGVTKQTGACIIRLTMEAMGIAMEEVLSEGQTAQSELLENVRMNIKKIEEYKTVIRKLETDIKYFQGRANELSEIIDLFILSNASRNSIEG